MDRGQLPGQEITALVRSGAIGDLLEIQRRLIIDGATDSLLFDKPILEWWTMTSWRPSKSFVIVLKLIVTAGSEPVRFGARFVDRGSAHLVGGGLRADSLLL